MIVLKNANIYVSLSRFFSNSTSKSCHDVYFLSVIPINVLSLNMCLNGVFILKNEKMNNSLIRLYQTFVFNTNVYINNACET